MRIVHIADTHLGRRQYGIVEREQDLYNAFDEAVERIVGIKPDLVIHSGDIFDSYRPAPWTLLRAVNGIMRIVESGASFIAVQGNHDLGPSPEGGKDSPFPLLERIFGGKFIYLGRRRPFVELGDVIVCGMPYHPASMRKHLISGIEEIAKSVERLNGLKIAVLHQGVAPFFSEYKTEIHKADIERLPFDYFALGHYHNRYEHTDGRKTYAYPGSTENIEEREVEESRTIGKGFFVLDGGRREFIRLERVRPYYILKRRISSVIGVEELAEEVRRIALSEKIPPMIRIRASTREDLMEELNKAHKDLLEELEGRYLRILLDLTSEDVERFEIQGTSSLDVEEMLRDLFRERDLERELGIEIYRAFREGKRGDDLRDFVMKKLERWLDEADIG